MTVKAGSSRYSAIIERIFVRLHKANPKANEYPFSREDLSKAASELKIELPKNLGDILYSTKFRAGMPAAVKATERDGKVWVIEGAGRARYKFRLAHVSDFSPNPMQTRIKIPDATPELISSYALDDEQALLAKVRYNRLIDTFLGLTTYSLQNHLRSTVKGVGQMEIDELYVGVDRRGCHYLIPVQAKGGSDKNSSVQILQDFRWCGERWPAVRCRPIAAYFIDSDTIALFELAVEGDEVTVLEQRHYQLVPGDAISDSEKARYDTE
jgi:hypothetical protein